MIDRQPDILVEVKHLHARPVDPRRGHQRLEKLDLRGAGRGNEPRLSLRGDDVAENLRRVPRRGAAHGLPIDVSLYLHGVYLHRREV